MPPSIRVNGGTAGEKAEVSAGATVTATLDSTDGVRQTAWTVSSTDETSAVGSYTLTQSGSVGQTIEFTALGEGTALILQVVINAGIDQATGLASVTATRARVKVYVPTSAGLEVGCVGEEFESDETYGSTAIINSGVRLASTLSPSGIPIKIVKAATAAALPTNTRSDNVLTASSNGAFAAVDDVALSPGDRFLAQNEGGGASHVNNGIYTLTTAGSVSTPWTATRAVDYDASGDLVQGVPIVVQQGTTYEGKFRKLATAGATINVTALEFDSFGDVSSVTADAPIASSGGATPNITWTPTANVEMLGYGFTHCSSVTRADGAIAITAGAGSLSMSGSTTASLEANGGNLTLDSSAVVKVGGTNATRVEVGRVGQPVRHPSLAGGGTRYITVNNDGDESATAGGSTYTAGDGLTESPAGTFNVVAADASITVNANSIEASGDFGVKPVLTDGGLDTDGSVVLNIGTGNATSVVVAQGGVTTYVEDALVAGSSVTAGTGGFLGVSLDRATSGTFALGASNITALTITPNTTVSGTLTKTGTALTTTIVAGIVAENTTAALVGTQVQNGFAVVSKGSIWDTGSASPKTVIAGFLLEGIASSPAYYRLRLCADPGTGTLGTLNTYQTNNAPGVGGEGFCTQTFVALTDIGNGYRGVTTGGTEYFAIKTSGNQAVFEGKRNTSDGRTEIWSAITTGSTDDGVRIWNNAGTRTAGNILSVGDGGTYTAKAAIRYDGRLLAPSIDCLSAGTLTIGASTATAVTVTPETTFDTRTNGTRWVANPSTPTSASNAIALSLSKQHVYHETTEATTVTITGGASGQEGVIVFSQGGTGYTVTMPNDGVGVEYADAIEALGLTAIVDTTAYTRTVLSYYVLPNGKAAIYGRAVITIT